MRVKSNRPKITARTGERLVRWAYEMEYLASVMRGEGHDSEG